MRKCVSFCLLTKLSILDCILHNLAEQSTEEQQDREGFTDVTDEISGVDIDILESSEEVTLPKASVEDSTNRVILEESFPKEESLDFTIDEEKDVQLKDDSEKPTALSALHG